MSNNNYQNLDVKFYAKKNRVMEKDIAKEMNVSYSTLLMYLRFPLDEDHKLAIVDAIDNVVDKRNGSIKCFYVFYAYKNKHYPIRILKRRKHGFYSNDDFRFHRSPHMKANVISTEHIPYYVWAPPKIVNKKGLGKFRCAMTHSQIRYLFDEKKIGKKGWFYVDDENIIPFIARHFNKVDNTQLNCYTFYIKKY